MEPASAAYGYAATASAVRPRQMVLVAVPPWDIHGAARAEHTGQDRTGVP